MPGWKIVHPGGVEQPIESRKKLEETLDRFIARRDEKPFGVELAGPLGTLAFGVGRSETVLSHTPANKYPPYHVSRGSAPEGEVIVYYFGGQWTEFGSEMAVPWVAAKRAILDYFDTGGLSPVIEWAEV